MINLLVSQTLSVHYETNDKNKMLLVIDGYKFCSSNLVRFAEMSNLCTYHYLKIFYKK
jgi:hypothetical protein